MPPTTNDKGSGLGHVPDSKDDDDHVVDTDKLHLGGNAPLPATFNVFDNTILGVFLSYKHYIYDQGQVGSCVTNAVAAAYRYGLQRQSKDPSYKPSRLFLYYTAQIPDSDITATTLGRAKHFASLSTNPPTKVLNNDSGSDIREVIRIMANLGALHEEKTLSAKLVKDPSTNEEYFPPGALPSLAPNSLPFSAAQMHMTFHCARPHESMGAECWKQCIQGWLPGQLWFPRI
ncbi:hypothetical protein BDV96DRAFT_597508 [Lophiotrema nucula]|uniref:Peptidase C1A papain C-terminal domain-containing protein n=1 Tax=Lophiotrema nucula TaxID=690887 RepID=A0A6A5ZEG1_9PLEO|nr:hypothetical protein BDV96DRAFT_597508 [Lophiotrema nucula]